MPIWPDPYLVHSTLGQLTLDERGAGRRVVVIDGLGGGNAISDGAAKMNMVLPCTVMLPNDVWVTLQCEVECLSRGNIGRNDETDFRCDA